MKIKGSNYLKKEFLFFSNVLKKRTAGVGSLSKNEQRRGGDPPSTIDHEKKKRKNTLKKPMWAR